MKPSLNLKLITLSKSIKWILLLLLIYAGTITVKADQQKIDSLKLRTNLPSLSQEEKVKTLYELGWAYRRSDIDTSLFFMDSALALAKTTNNFDLLGVCQNKKGALLRTKGDYNGSITLYFEAIDSYAKVPDSLGIADAYNNLGVLFKKQKNYDEAIRYYNEAFKIKLKYGDTLSAVITYTNLGNVFWYKDSSQLSLPYFRLAEQIANLKKDSYVLSFVYNCYASAFENLERYDSAIYYQSKALDIERADNDLLGMIQTLKGIGSMYKHSKKYNQALGKYQESIELCNQIGAFEEIKESYLVLSEIYEIQGKTAMAFDYYKKYSVIKDSLFDSHNSDVLNNLNVKYQTSEKERQLVEQTAARIASQKETEKQRLLSERKSYFILFFVVLMLFVLVLLIISIRSYRRSQVANKLILTQKEEVESKKKEVEEKNKEITDSINYAKRIQTAILPPDRIVKEYLQDAFILYKPKDVVAGDFYWMEKKGDTLLFAAADCTGHGVPGAMVNVICNNALNRAVREHGLLDPAKVLDKAREIVIQEFEKSDQEVKDGMDISLCALNGNILSFSGANNPLWLIRSTENDRNEEGELIELKANRQPVGKFIKPVPFTTQQVELKKGDTIYLFSDGFADQFGGPKGRKFKTKQFKQLLVALKAKSMDEQKRRLEQSFANWKGDQDQLDDVCVIGFRFD